MILDIKQKHIDMGRPKLDRDPISLACQEALSLPYYCIKVYSKVLIVCDYSGASVHTERWPAVIVDFNRRYWDFFMLGVDKLPKPCSTTIGSVQLFPGKRVNMLERKIHNIRNWAMDDERVDIYE